MTEQQQSDQPTKSDVSMIEAPPTTIGGILRRLGPGLIVAGSIVGSGELIATTKTGAEAGFWLLWLILIGCVIKVFCQVELGRYSIISGKTTMAAMNMVPGPRAEISLTGRPGSRTASANWLVWYWFLMFLASIGQLGGIVGGVGQALAISVPLTQQGRDFNLHVEDKIELRVVEAELALFNSADTQAAEPLRRRQAELTERIAQADAAWIDKLGAERYEELGNKPPAPPDDRLWAAIVAVATAGILVFGRYGLIQSFSTVMVALFTLITVLNVVLLQNNPTFGVSFSDIVQGMSFRLPPRVDPAISPLATALATFGIIGVGASELVVYPYWCLEKGYARFTGPRDASEQWADRARGWMRVMHWDAWCSMVVYTFATIAFYLLGAAILGRTGLNPASSDMVRTLAVMYEPVFGSLAPPLFLFGAFAVLYSTYFVANASHARVFSDVLRVLRIAPATEESRRRSVRFFSGLFPLMCLMVYVFFPQPATLVLLSGLMQAMMLPMLAIAALYFRYYHGDERIAPSKLWDLFLWISAAGMTMAGVWALLSKVFNL